MLIKICRDGSLKVGDDNDIFQSLDTSDPFAVPHILRGHVTLEDGLTVRQLFKALRPWSSFFSSSAIMNFEEFSNGVDQTYLVEADASVTPLLHVEIYPVLQLRRLENGSLTVGAYWDFCGRYGTPIDVGYGLMSDIVSLSFVDLKTYANLPIVISNKAKVISHGLEVIERSRPLLVDQMAGIYSHIEIPPVFFDVIVLGFLDKISFFGTPTETAQVADEIKSSLQTIEASEHASVTYDVDLTSCELNIPNEAEEGNSFIEFCAELGIDVDEHRANIVREVMDELSRVPLPSPQLELSLGLTALGMAEIANGITAHFATTKLEEMLEVIQSSSST
jgi:hypothetical protein